jgi:hypothetical protein
VGARTERTGTQSETEEKEMNDPLADYKWREGQMIENRVKYWEIIADNLSKAG